MESTKLIIDNFIIMEGQFEKQLLSGAFKNNMDLISNPDYHQKIIKYLNTVKIRSQVLDIVLSLLRFYRFPIALCCSHLYAQIEKASLQQQNQFKDKLLELAAYIRSLLLSVQLKIFPQIQFFFKWGQAKKKFLINPLPQQKQFLNLIAQLSNQKKQLQSLSKSDLSVEEKREKINQFLGRTLKNINSFEEKSIQYMKSSSAHIIQSIQKQEDLPKDKKAYKKMVKQKSIQKIQIQSQNVQSTKIQSITSNIQKEQVFLGFVQKSQQSQKMKNLCCRPFFIDNEIIQYPQSIRVQYKFYKFPFYNNQNENPSKQQKIKRTICGFLNAQGGIIYFGIKELTQSRKRIVQGLVLTQRLKKDFTRQIMRLTEQVLPDVGKKCTVKYVPIRGKDSAFITGRYVVKVVVDRGAKNQVYSYIQQNFQNYKIQKFTFRTENQILQISEIQRVLRIFKDKLESPQRQFYPTHSYPCLEPLVGKPLYDRQQYQQQVDEIQYKREVPALSKPQKLQYQKRQAYMDNNDYYPDQQLSEDTAALEKYDQPQTWKQQEQIVKRRKYMQKSSLEVLVNLPQEELDIFIRREFIDYQLKCKINENWILLLVSDAKELKKFDSLKGAAVEAYPRISYKELQGDQITLMQQIIQQYRNKWNVITREPKDKIMIFKSTKPACQFYLRMIQMGLNVTLTPLHP